MNERIKELANEALLYVSDRDSPGTIEINQRLEKFAELVVKECTNIAEAILLGKNGYQEPVAETRSVDYSAGYVDGYISGKSFAIKTAAEECKKHFGIDNGS